MVPPSVRYQDVEHCGTCVAAGAASALYYLGDCLAAEAVHAAAKDIYDRRDGSLTCLSSLTEVMQKFNYKVEGANQLTGGKVTWDRSNLKEILLRDHSDHPTCVVLKDNLGTCTHSVTLCGEYIFDSNEQFALPLCDQSLNRCCADNSNPLVSYTCDGIVEAYRFVESKRVRKRRKISATQFRET